MIRKRKNKKQQIQDSGRNRQTSGGSNYDQRRYLYHSVSLERSRNLRNQSPNGHNKSTKDTSPINEIITKSNYVNVNFFRFWSKRILIIFIISILVVAAIRMLQLSPTQINVSATNNQLDSQYIAVVYGVVNNSWLNGNKLTLNKSDISSALKTKFPDITQVSTSLNLFKKTIYVKIFTSPATIFLSTTYNGGLINNQGRVVDTAISANQSDLTIVNFPVNLKLKVNDYALTADNINFINTVTYELKSKNISVNHYVILPGDNELDAYIATKDYYVKFNLRTNDAINQSGTFLALYHYLSINNINPSEYIDVRIDGRAYFK